jgi:hypothetical protein
MRQCRSRAQQICAARRAWQQFLQLFVCQCLATLVLIDMRQCRCVVRSAQQRAAQRGEFGGIVCNVGASMLGLAHVVVSMAI